MKPQEDNPTEADAQIDAFASSLALPLSQKVFALTEKLFPEDKASALVLFLEICGSAAGVLLGLAEGSVSEGYRPDGNLDLLSIQDVKKSRELLLGRMKRAMERNREALLAASKDAAAIRYGHKKN